MNSYWIGFEAMDHVRKLHSIPNEEYWKVVSNQVIIALLRVAKIKLLVSVKKSKYKYLQLCGKTSRIPHCLRPTA